MIGNNERGQGTKERTCANIANQYFAALAQGCQFELESELSAKRIHSKVNKNFKILFQQSH